MSSCFALSAIHLVAAMASLTAAGNLLGGEAVIDRYHDQFALLRELAAHHVMGFEVADHPAAAVKEHQTGREAAALP
jgi:hypothetical protein